MCSCDSYQIVSFLWKTIDAINKDVSIQSREINLLANSLRQNNVLCELTLSGLERIQKHNKDFIEVNEHVLIIKQHPESLKNKFYYDDSDACFNQLIEREWRKIQSK